MTFKLTDTFNQQYRTLSTNITQDSLKRTKRQSEARILTHNQGKPYRITLASYETQKPILQDFKDEYLYEQGRYIKITKNNVDALFNPLKDLKFFPDAYSGPKFFPDANLKLNQNLIPSFSPKGLVRTPKRRLVFPQDQEQDLDQDLDIKPLAFYDRTKEYIPLKTGTGNLRFDLKEYLRNMRLQRHINASIKYAPYFNEGLKYAPYFDETTSPKYEVIFNPAGSSYTIKSFLKNDDERIFKKNFAFPDIIEAQSYK